jgi:hypothetical protein
VAPGVRVAPQSRQCTGRSGQRSVTAWPLVSSGKMNLQPIAKEENQDRAQRGKNETGGMKSLVGRARKHVGKGAAQDPSDDAERDRPNDRYVRVHHRFRDKPRD